MGNWISARDKVKETETAILKQLELKKLTQNATTGTLKLYNRVKMAIAGGHLDENGITILQRVVTTRYCDADLPLALRMLDDLLTANTNSNIVNVGNLSLDLLACAVHQPPAFITKLFAAGICCGAATNVEIADRMKMIFADYFFGVLYRIRDLTTWNPTRVQQHWKELEEGILFFCRYGCRPEIRWSVAIDDILMEQEEMSADSFVDKSSTVGKVNYLRQVELAMNVVKCILHHGIATETDFSERSSQSGQVRGQRYLLADLLLSCVRRQRYDLANSLIEYGHICGFNCIDKAGGQGKLYLGVLRKIPELAIGFSKRLERQNRYLTEFAKLSPTHQHPKLTPTTCLFEVRNLLLMIVDYV